MLSKDAAKKMSEANKDYVPFHRHLEAVTGSANGKASSGMVNAAHGIRRIKGSDLEIVDPLKTIMQNTFAFRDVAARNQSAVGFMDMLKSVRGAGKFADQVAKKMQGTQVTVKEAANEVFKHLEAQGLDPDIADGLRQMLPDEAFSIFRAVNRPDAKTGEVTVMRDGKPEMWQIADESLYKALMLEDQPQLFSESTFINKAITVPP